MSGIGGFDPHCPMPRIGMSPVVLVLTSLVLLVVLQVSHAEDSSRPRRIAFLTGEDPLSAQCASDPPHLGFGAFQQGLRALGYRQGENVEIVCRSAEGRYDKLDALAAELVRLEPAVIVAAAAPPSLAAKRATSRIPVISVYTADPVGLGLVASLSRPGGNVTGISALASDHAAKSLQLLKEAAPRTSRVGVLGHAANPTQAIYRREIESASRVLGITLDFALISSPDDFESALSAMQRRGADALLVMHQPFTFVHRERIVGLVARLGLPAMYASREAVALGGLISYAVSVEDTFRRAAFFVDKVLRGAKPSDLPVEQPTTFELAVNLKTAKLLGLQIPSSLRLRADQVVE